MTLGKWSFSVQVDLKTWDEIKLITKDGANDITVKYEHSSEKGTLAYFVLNERNQTIYEKEYTVEGDPSKVEVRRTGPMLTDVNGLLIQEEYDYFVDRMMNSTVAVIDSEDN